MVRPRSEAVIRLNRQITAQLFGILILSISQKQKETLSIETDSLY